MDNDPYRRPSNYEHRPGEGRPAPCAHVEGSAAAHSDGTRFSRYSIRSPAADLILIAKVILHLTYPRELRRWVQRGLQRHDAGEPVSRPEQHEEDLHHCHLGDGQGKLCFDSHEHARGAHESHELDEANATQRAQEVQIVD